MKNNSEKRTTSGIKKKVLTGFILIGLILFLSSVIAIFEYLRMTQSVSDLIDRNTTKVNTAKQLIKICDDFNLLLLEKMNDTDAAFFSESDLRRSFYKELDALPASYSPTEATHRIDSVRVSFDLYLSVVQEIDSVWSEDFDIRREWYINRLLPRFFHLRESVGVISERSGFALEDSYISLKESFYRSIMPGVVAVGVGIVLVILFNLFLNTYLINPMIKINRGVRDYKEYNKGYSVKIESNDDLRELNEGITDLIDENRTLKRNKY